MIAAFLLYRLHRVGQQVNHLTKQAEENRHQMAQVRAQSEAAARQASQAETHAQQAAEQRDQALNAEAQSQKAAQAARQQAETAQAQATQAQQKAAQFRQQREAELERLQNALGRIADTRRTAMGLIVTLGSKSIRFDFDKASLHPEDREVLSRIAGILSTLKGYHISVYGYTDDVGSQEYNLKLSERRAKTVRDYLVKAGLDPSIINTKGYGKSDPRVKGDTPEARAANRRVEIGIVDSSLHFQGPVSPSQ
ncbi:MAG TPA: OmpA family protein [Terriglobia bacterium]|nr:OmpA family protein [Terriglobia bacterium]